MNTIRLIPADYRAAFNQLKGLGQKPRTIIGVDNDGYLIICAAGLMDCDEYDRLKEFAIQIAKLRLRNQATQANQCD